MPSQTRRMRGHTADSCSGSSASSSAGSQSGSISLGTSEEYDRARTKTLMFFLDRLYMGATSAREPPSLHDLSCLFGTREFTKEMRLIVGASRNGLKKFLQSYPSLFTVDANERVHLSAAHLGVDGAPGAGAQGGATSGHSPAACAHADGPTALVAAPNRRDYNQEAVEYFRDKLLQFGPSLVPIRNLLGYRSQASQEVRHVSGKSVREFQHFLAGHDDVFELSADQEHVILRSHLANAESLATHTVDGPTSSAAAAASAPNSMALEQQQQAHDSLSSLQLLNGSARQRDSPRSDPYLSKQFSRLVEQYLRSMTTQDDHREDDHDHKDDDATKGPARHHEDESKCAPSSVSLEQLHERLTGECQNKLFLSMVHTLDDLRMFLRMHPKLFTRLEHDRVRLTSAAERQALSQPNPKARPDSGKAASAAAAAAAAAAPSTTTSTVDRTSEQMNSLPYLASEARHRALARTSSCLGSADVVQRAAKSTLRASATPFVPASQAQRAPLRRSVSNMGQPSSGSASVSVSADGRQTLRSYLLKASAANSANGLYAPSKPSNGAPPASALEADPQAPHSRRVSGHDLSAQDLRARTVDIVRGATNVVSRILQGDCCEVVAFDCKGANLGSDGQISLILLAYLPSKDSGSSAGKITNGSAKSETNNNNNNNKVNNNQPVKPEVCLFDLITNPELAYCLKPLLESPSVVKVVHDVRNKSSALYARFGIVLNRVFDTQVANLVIQQQETGKPTYKSRYISMANLCEVYGDESLMNYRNLAGRHKTRASSGGASTGQTSSPRDTKYWLQRPLSEAMAQEATVDVYCLIGGIYQNLKAQIKPEYEPLFEQLNMEGVLARIQPDEIRSVKKERKVDLEALELKRKLYTTPGHIVLSNREIRLLRHVDLNEEVRAKIKNCPKVAKKIERLDQKARAMSADAEQSLDLSNMSNVSSMPADEEAPQTDEEAPEQMNSLQPDINSIIGELKEKIKRTKLLESVKEFFRDADDDDDEHVEENLHEAIVRGYLDEARLIEACDANQREIQSIKCLVSSCKCECHRNTEPDGENPSPCNSANNKHPPSSEKATFDIAIQCDLIR